MAYQQQSNRPPNQYNQYPVSRPLYGNSIPPGYPLPSSVRRTPSFDPGDDARYGEGVNGNMEGNRGGQESSGGMQHDELHMGGVQSPSFPLRSTSYSTIGGDRNQREIPSTASRSSYNPQQYGPPQSQYSPQPQNTTSGAFSPTHQPYIPAAYSNNTRYQANHAIQSSESPQQPFSPTMSSQSFSQPPPPPPQRSYEQQYGSHMSLETATDVRTQYSTMPTDPSQLQPNLPLQPTWQSPATNYSYTPPVPPPPPFSASEDAYPSNTVPAISSTSLQQSASNRSPSAQNALPPLPSYQSDTTARIPSPSIQRRPVGSGNDSRNDRSLPPTPGTPGPTPPTHSPRLIDTFGRHPQARPLPGPPPSTDYFGNSSVRDEADERMGYDDLMQEVEAAIMGRPAPSISRRSPRPTRNSNHVSIDETQSNRSPITGGRLSGDGSHDLHNNSNGHIEEIAEGQYVDYDAYSDRSDAEAEAGLAAMHMADEQDAADEARRQSGRDSLGRSYNAQQARMHPGGEYSSDSDVYVDMDTYGGGFSSHVPYRDQDSYQAEGQGYANNLDDQGRPFAETRSSQRSGGSATLYEYPIPGSEHIHPFAPARVDRSGTGGLSEPGSVPRRLSFEDGDEVTLADSEEATSGAQSPSRNSMQEMFFHPGMGSGRPLPQAPPNNLSVQTVPPAGTSQNPQKLLQYDQYGRPRFPAAPDAYDQLLTPQGTPVPRSSSLVSHSNTPQTVPPIRSKTDADRARILKQQQMGLRVGSVYGTDSIGDPSLNPSAEIVGLLPEIPTGKRRKFNPSKLSTADFKRCSEPWALSSIVAWIKEMSEGEADLKEGAIIEGIVALFTHKVPTMNTADAEVLGAKVVEQMIESETLVKDEEWVKIGTGTMSGILFQLTGTGCYSPFVHTQNMPGRCYSHHCMRTLKRVNLQAQKLEPQRKVEEWVTFWKITKEQIEAVDNKEVQRQNNLHEIITTEDNYMDNLYVLQVLYRDELAKWQPPIISPKRRESFLQDVFGKVDAVKEVNEEYLLSALKYRQNEQGPWIKGFSDIFREWIRKAKQPYIEYAANFPDADSIIRQEAARNLLFKQFLDQAQENQRSKRLDWNTYLKAPITRLQRYSLLLQTVYNHTMQDSSEKTNLAAAIKEVKDVTLECDGRVAEMKTKVDLKELQAKLQLRAGMQDVHLNLTHMGREIIFQGDLERRGSAKFSWVDTHAILFDHFMVLAKVVTVRDAAGGLKYEKYDVSKKPIPMDLLVLESTNDDPVVKSTMKGLGSVTTMTTKANAPTETRPSRQSMSNPSGGPGTLQHMNTASSAASMQTNGSNRTIMGPTVLDSPKDEKILYPFRVKHLGRDDLYILYAPSSKNRDEWCDKIIEAKTRHAASLYRQNAEPFRLRVIADIAFAYDAMSGQGKSILIRGTPLDRAIREVEKTYQDKGSRPNPVCRAAVNCATSFNQPYGSPMFAVGTDYGVYVSSQDNARGWTRAISATRVTQIAVLEEFSLFILLADKSLIAYHLETVCPLPTAAPSPNNTSDSSRRAPQKLSGSRDVGFFATGRMKERALVFYKKREGVSSIFKVLEPVYQKSSTQSSSMRSRFGIKKGSVEFFRDFDDFYIASETYAINLFHSSLAVSTARGIEVLTLDKKLPISIPDLKGQEVASIAQQVAGQRPLGMFRLSDSEFLLVFEEVGIYCNKHGDVSRSVVLNFVSKARQACLIGSMFLLLVDAGGAFVEVRNAINGRLRQIISGRDVRLLDDGVNGGKVKICMQHPEESRCQIIVEMIVNEGLKE